MQYERTFFIIEQYGYTPHHWACIKGHRKIVDLLLSREARLKKRYNQSQQDAQRTPTARAMSPPEAVHSSGSASIVDRANMASNPSPIADVDAGQHVRRPSEIEPIEDGRPTVSPQGLDDDEGMLTDPASSDEDEGEYLPMQRRRSSQAPAPTLSNGRMSLAMNRCV